MSRAVTGSTGVNGLMNLNMVIKVTSFFWACAGAYNILKQRLEVSSPMNNGGFQVTERAFFPVAVTVTFSGTVHRAARNSSCRYYKTFVITF